MRQKQRIDTVTETTTSKFYCFQSGKIKFHRIITSDVRCKGNLFSKDKGIGHVLVTCRSNDVTSLEVTLLEVTLLTNDVGHLPVTSSYVTYYYYNYYLK